MRTPDEPDYPKDPAPTTTELIGDTLFTFDAHGRPLRAETRTRLDGAPAKKPFTYRYDPYGEFRCRYDDYLPEPPEA